MTLLLPLARSCLTTLTAKLFLLMTSRDGCVLTRGSVNIIVIVVVKKLQYSFSDLYIINFTQNLENFYSRHHDAADIEELESSVF